MFPSVFCCNCKLRSLCNLLTCYEFDFKCDQKIVKLNIQIVKLNLIHEKNERICDKHNKFISFEGVTIVVSN